MSSSSSSSSSLSSSEMNVNNVENFIKSLQCPISLSLLDKAVTLIPCCHKINEVNAKEMYGDLQVNNCVSVSKPCPVCNTIVSHYYVDHFVRSLIQIVSGSKAEEIIPQASILIEAEPKENIDNIPFPGKGAKFVHKTGNWTFFYSGGDLNRCMEFSSRNDDSLFTEFSLLGYRDGDVCISIHFEDKNYEIVKDYFKQIGLDHKDVEFFGMYIARNHDDVKLLFKILAKYNEIPADKFDFIKDLVEKEKCN
jgi:hypothetical protein